jgi:hypothetical protein
MRRLFDDPDAARRLGAAGRQALTQRHTAARAGDWFARKYDEIVREEHAA